MIEEIESISLERIESVYQDDSLNLAIIDNFPHTKFPVQETKHKNGQFIGILQVEKPRLRHWLKNCSR